MTNQEHPITPPPELVRQWIDTDEGGQSVASHIATCAAQWGSDQELEACCEWLRTESKTALWQTEALRAARRPKPQTLNSIALQMLGTIERDAHYLPEITDTIRRALEALPND